MVAKLCRLADCLEQGKRSQIQIAGERILVPADTTFNIEHERGSAMEEVSFHLAIFLIYQAFNYAYNQRTFKPERQVSCIS